MNLTEGITAERLLLGDEAVATGAMDAGITAAYGYPGSPSTEILQYLIELDGSNGPVTEWCTNEKTAYEEALGVSLMGFRTLVTMKHVGLNMAADPFVNSAIVQLQGGLVVAVADDPSMHTSQNEQDSRYLADFARVICLEPADHQQAYDMTREAFELSERFQIPVLIRLVTRLARSRAAVRTGSPIQTASRGRARDRTAWILLPANARIRWRKRIESHREIEAYSESSANNPLISSERNQGLGVITTGIARNYYNECRNHLQFQPDWLHIGAYPYPAEKIRKLTRRVNRLLVFEEGYPYIERFLRGILPSPLTIMGRMSGHLAPDGELTEEGVRHALNLSTFSGMQPTDFPLPQTPTQFGAGCRHRDAFTSLKQALEGLGPAVVTGDIGCYTFGTEVPPESLDSCVCTGASIGMAKGAADAGAYPVVALIDENSFCHSGIAPLMDAVAANADITVIVLDNEVEPANGTRKTDASSRIHRIVLGLGVPEEHCRLVESHPGRIPELTELIRRELEYRGLSVIVSFHK